MKGEETVDYWLRSTWLTVQKMYNEKAADYNSSMVTGFTLLSISPKSGTPSTSLGPKMGIEPTSLSRTLKNLEERELIYREPNPNDGRGVIIKLTDYGLKMRDLSRQTVVEFNQLIKEKVTEKQLENFLEVMQIIQKIIVQQKELSANEK